MSLNLRGMTREEAVDESIQHFQKLLDDYSEAGRILYHEYGIRPGIITSEKRKREADMVSKYPQYKDTIGHISGIFLLNKLKIRLENLKKVRSADKKGYLESLTLVRNPDDDLLDVESSKSKQGAKNTKVAKPAASANVSRPSSPNLASEPASPVATPNPEVNDPWWYEAKSNKGTYYYTANGRTTWTKPNKVAPASGGRTRRRRNKNKKNKKSRKH